MHFISLDKIAQFIPIISTCNFTWYQQFQYHKIFLLWCYLLIKNRFINKVKPLNSIQIWQHRFQEITRYNSIIGYSYPLAMITTFSASINDVQYSFILLSIIRYCIGSVVSSYYLAVKKALNPIEGSVEARGASPINGRLSNVSFTYTQSGQLKSILLLLVNWWQYWPIKFLLAS